MHWIVVDRRLALSRAMGSSGTATRGDTPTGRRLAPAPCPRGPRRTPRGAYALLLASGALLVACNDPGDLDGQQSADLAAGTGFEGEAMTGSQAVLGDATASGGSYRKFWNAGSATITSTVGVASTGVVVRAAGDQCNGAPTMVLKVDGTQVLSTAVSQTGWTSFPATVALAAGSHTFEISYPNDYYVSSSCDRNLKIDSVTFTAGSSPPPPPSGGSGASFEAETMTLPTSAAIYASSTASGGRAVRLWQAATPTKTVSLSAAATGLRVRAAADLCNGGAAMTVSVDGTQVLSGTASSTSWADFAVTRAFAAGSHTVAIAFTNDYYGGTGCDRNLLLDSFTFVGGTVADAGTSTDSGTPPDASTAMDAGTAMDASVCTPESNAAFCTRLGKNCGMVTGTDNCGSSRTVSSCGSCASPQTCGGGGASNVCGGGTTTGDVILVAAGDFNPAGTAGSTTNPGRTAQSMRNINPELILGLGDFQYTTGTTSNLLAGFDKNFGDLKPRFLPTAGPTHDVASATDQMGYPGYWGRDAYKPYSRDVGNWHIVSLPSAVYRYNVDTAGVLAWLRNDLAANTKPCTLAFWHEPYWTRPTDTHPTGLSSVRPWMDALYAAGAELVLNGHQHNYQRFAPMRPDGTRDANGLREFVVGSGGIGTYPFTGSAPNVEISNDTTYGVLRLVLHANGYEWQFVPNNSGGFSDAGSGSCH